MELKPCPFCGSVNLAEESTGASEIKGVCYQTGWIECNDCGACGKPAETNDGDTPVTYEAVREAWNRRATDENAAYERAAKVTETVMSGEQDDITRASHDRIAAAIRALIKEKK